MHTLKFKDIFKCYALNLSRRVDKQQIFTNFWSHIYKLCNLQAWIHLWEVNYLPSSVGFACPKQCHISSLFLQPSTPDTMSQSQTAVWHESWRGAPFGEVPCLHTCVSCDQRMKCERMQSEEYMLRSILHVTWELPLPLSKLMCI